MGFFQPQLFSAAVAATGSPCNGMLLTQTGIADCRAAGLAGGTLGQGGGLIQQ